MLMITFQVDVHRMLVGDALVELCAEPCIILE